ncbi:hypothetical protein ACFFUB_02575 [Algimonas porphyrae]|uniref:Uncharacterized protein n=1 Tax=Algimonas porphyrae TaxID=1128113 RepID=A0ABQ5UYG9_9PROT|nr:hypothetical protein [Algimonas porphyrae]GLQ20355.1 hypothetical protein GCM10007854_13100 [Algimonas porphyrae]
MSDVTYEIIATVHNGNFSAFTVTESGDDDGSIVLRCGDVEIYVSDGSIADLKAAIDRILAEREAA